MTTRSVLLGLASYTRHAAQQQCWYSVPAAKQSPIELVKQLRAQTGAPIGDIKKALEKTDNNVQAAIDALRTMGVAAAAKKATRSATEGLVGLATANGAAALVELNCETDFVARSDQFMRLPRAIAAQALQCAPRGGAPGAAGAVEVPLDTLNGAALESGGTVADAVQDAAGVLRENVALRRAVVLRGAHVAAYVHNALGPGVGSIGALVALESPALEGGAAVPRVLAELGSNLAMQVAAMQPLCVNTDGVPADMLAHEKRVLAERAAAEGKSGPVVEKIVAGRLGKFYEEHVLMQQGFILDDKATVQQAVKAAAAEVGAAVTVSGMAFLKVGGSTAL